MTTEAGAGARHENGISSVKYYSLTTASLLTRVVIVDNDE
jgi:hypothetical protein